ncbi:MAG: hypothetical protein HYZ23_02930 [Chloroflexi bacterium]|jgi:hypothetical protein|nr:hypothetical protein [Chloroflexota bacterium]
MNKSVFPTARDFQESHRKLMGEYVAAIDIASRLPFFVNLTELLVPEENESAFMRWNRLGMSFFTPFTWKPFLVFLIEMHIRSKAGEMIVAYNQLALRLPAGREYNRFRTALKAAAGECNQMNETLVAWKSGKTFMAGAVPVALGWFTSWLGTDDVLSALPRFGVMVSENFASGDYQLFARVSLWVAMSTGLFLFLLNQAFEGKRAVFLPVFTLDKIKASSHNVYASEDALFELIGHRKTPEFALDALGLTVGMIAALALFMLRIRYYPFSTSVLNYCGVIAISAVVVIAFIHYKRRWK